jgi:hypothetical protein
VVGADRPLLELPQLLVAAAVADLVVILVAVTEHQIEDQAVVLANATHLIIQVLAAQGLLL